MKMRNNSIKYREMSFKSAKNHGAHIAHLHIQIFRIKIMHVNTQNKRCVGIFFALCLIQRY